MQNQIINIDPDILGGTPVFSGTRVPIKNLFDYLETGETIDFFLDDFSGVQREQVIKLLEMSQKLIETSSNILHENIAWRMCNQTSETAPRKPWSLYSSWNAVEWY